MAKKDWYKELLKISLCINIIMTLFPNFRSGSAIFYFNLQIGLAYYYLSLTKPSKSVTILLTIISSILGGMAIYHLFQSLFTIL
ncbi:hypothetical protein [Enterococcus hirae]|uniref:hypothetical protein n=1 Tax=Enterococcus hirae TaxID=1354 RepID=UPI00383D0226